jgi:hypothetical protein
LLNPLGLGGHWRATGAHAVVNLSWRFLPSIRDAIVELTRARGAMKPPVMHQRG